MMGCPSELVNKIRTVRSADCRWSLVRVWVSGRDDEKPMPHNAHPMMSSGSITPEREGLGQMGVRAVRYKSSTPGGRGSTFGLTGVID